MAFDWGIMMTAASTLFAAASAKAALDTVRETRASGKESEARNRIAEEQRRILMRPHVIIYVRPGKTHDDFLERRIYVHNVGPGAARNVVFDVIKGEDYILPASNRHLKEWGVISEGLVAMPPGDLLSTTFQSEDQVLEMGQDVLIEVRYQDVEGHSYLERFDIDVKFLMHTNGPTVKTSSNSPEERVARSLETLARKFEAGH